MCGGPGGAAGKGNDMALTYRIVRDARRRSLKAAVENGELCACLCRVSARGVVSELMRLPGLPGALLSLPDGGLLMGALGQLLRLRADLRVLRRCRCGLPARLRLYPGFALCADPLDGRLLRIPLRDAPAQTLYMGEVEDAVIN